MTREDMVLLIEAEDTINNMNAVFMQLTGFGYADGEFAKLDNVFEVILNNSDKSYSMDEDETFFYDKEFQIFHVPQSAEETDESIKARDLNYLYRFNGYQFVYFGNDEDFIGKRIIK